KANLLHDALFSKDSTAQQKLAVVREMAKGGNTDLSYRDGSGVEHKLRAEIEKKGNSELVHLWAKGSDGKEQIALRGVARADGTIDQEKDRSGRAVDFQGKGYSQLNLDQNNVLTAKKTDGKDQSSPAQTAPSSDQAALQKDKTAPVRPDQIPGPEKLPNLSLSGIDRSRFSEELKDPKVWAAFAGRMHSEVGDQGPKAQLAFAEEVFNRAYNRDQTLKRALSGAYYPTAHPGISHN